MTKRRFVQAFMVLIGFALPFAPEAFANGGKAKNAEYRAGVVPPGGQGMVEFESSTSPILFYLGTVNRKYHVLLIRAQNRSNVALRLSAQRDSIRLHYANGLEVDGVFDLRAVDPATWDGLDEEMRKAVVYPPEVPAREEEGIYVFVPVDTVTAPRKEHAMPSSISYKIESLPRPIELRAPVAKA